MKVSIGGFLTGHTGTNQNLEIGALVVHSGANTIISGAIHPRSGAIKNNIKESLPLDAQIFICYGYTHKYITIKVYELKY